MKCPACAVEMQPVCPLCRAQIQSALIHRTKLQQGVFHQLCSSFTKAGGGGAAYAKVLFKYLHGVWVPYPIQGEGPTWNGRRFVLYKGLPDETQVFLKSEAEYNMREERELIEGTIAECFDIGAKLDWLPDALT